MPLTFPTGVTLDSATLAQWLTALQSCTPQEYVGFVPQFQRRFQRVVITAGLQGMGGDLGLGTRTEFTELLLSGKVFAARVVQGAVGAQSAQVQLFQNTAGILAIVLAARCSSSSLASMRASRDSVAFGGGTAAGFQLGAGVDNSVALVAGANGAALPGNAIDEQFVLASTVWQPHFSVFDGGAMVLTQGRGLNLQAVTQNVTLDASFVWVEVPTSYPL